MTSRTEARIAGEGTSSFCTFAQPAETRANVSPANEIVATNARLFCYHDLECFISHLTTSLPLQEDNSSAAVESPLAIENSNDCRRPRRNRVPFFSLVRSIPFFYHSLLLLASLFII